ncbi:LOW QUALITY PROTEIN: hypothetical protein OSB04_011401 [Centaurea solstitialis]|uniref:Pentatricopeptide repeat-containing protein n=1 Tax=Centaurea solstitialis TaxID=347529 RepID=A0AA38WDN0_9ASTR|nr:LOW QUALITY PROTEIN: hypothetical protein OSB04_011401 [Centaurea solstitialis]
MGINININKAMHMFDEIIEKGLCNNDQVDKALSLFHLMSDNKLNFAIFMNTIPINGANKCRRLDTNS